MPKVHSSQPFRFSTKVALVKVVRMRVTRCRAYAPYIDVGGVAKRPRGDRKSEMRGASSRRKLAGDDADFRDFPPPLTRHNRRQITPSNWLRRNWYHGFSLGHSPLAICAFYRKRVCGEGFSEWYTKFISIFTFSSEKELDLCKILYPPPPRFFPISTF